MAAPAALTTWFLGGCAGAASELCDSAEAVPLVPWLDWPAVLASTETKGEPDVCFCASSGLVLPGVADGMAMRTPV
jgi:hypothetical protein